MACMVVSLGVGCGTVIELMSYGSGAHAMCLYWPCLPVVVSGLIRGSPSEHVSVHSIHAAVVADLSCCNDPCGGFCCFSACLTRQALWWWWGHGRGADVPSVIVLVYACVCSVWCVVVFPADRYLVVVCCRLAY